MLYITQGNKTTAHRVGRELPSVTSNKVTFTVDGEELKALLSALKNSDSFKSQCKGYCQYECCFEITETTPKQCVKLNRHNHPCCCE